MNVKILKGTNQIGGCITEITSSQGTKILIDFGEDLPDENTKIKPLNIKGLTCDKSIYSAVFITHSHGDHIGLINKINSDIPIFIEKYNLLIYKKTYQYTNNLREDKELDKKLIYNFSFEKTIVIDDIKVTPYIADHSSYNSAMFLIECDGKKVLHTGDFRNHGRKKDVLINNLTKIKSVDLLITEGTSLSKDESICKSEEDLEKVASKLFEKYKQVYILQSSTNIDRIVSFYKARKNKEFVMDQFTCEITKLIKGNIPNYSWRTINTYKPSIYDGHRKNIFNHYFKEKVFNDFSKEFILMVKSSMIEDIKDKIKFLKENERAVLIYSMWPGYIKKQKSMEEFKNNIESLGVDFIELHTSGHADHETLKKVDELLDYPRVIIIHTMDKKHDVFKNVMELTDNTEVEV